MALLADTVLNSTTEAAALEAAKRAILREAESIADPRRVTLENAYFTSFRDDYFGQPSTGIRENIPLLQDSMVKDYRARNFVGPNITVSGSGAITLDQLRKLAGDKLGGLTESTVSAPLNARTPAFTPSVMMMRDDELANTAVAVSFKAPGYNDPDYFGMQLVKEVVGDYKISRDNLAHLNNVQLDYNPMHVFLGLMPDIVTQDCYYEPYSDTGLLGNFVFGNEVFSHPMLFGTQCVLTNFANHCQAVNLFRGRARVFNNLLNRHDVARVSLENSRQASHWGRLASRTEVATKVSQFDPPRFMRLINKWFYDHELSAVAWGPLHSVIRYHSYNRLYKRTTMGDFGSVQVALTQ
jgi:processing peptidase subunit beta